MCLSFYIALSCFSLRYFKELNLKNMNVKNYFKFIVLLFFGLLFFVSAGNPSFGALGDCCEHECNLTDPDRCRGNVVEECRNCDTDKYNDWCKATDCASTGKTCKKGSCTVASACIDVDGDGYGNPASGLCAKSTLDCDDSKAFINPGATENCDKKDNNCNSSTDEGCDSDSDGYCASAKKIYTDTSMCSNTIFISDGMAGNDCNDADKNISPGASEICGNGKDDDCSGGDAACACTENWACGAWGACSGGVVTRTCTDSNSCGTTVSKPVESQTCMLFTYLDPVAGLIIELGKFQLFQAGVSGGTAPYTYEWKSDKQGIFSTSSFSSFKIVGWALGDHQVTIKITDKDGNSISKTIAVKVVAAGSYYANILSPKDYAEIGRTASTFFYASTAGGVSPYTYEWKSDKSGVFATTQSAPVDTTSWPLGDHLITFTVKDSGSATAVKTVIVKVVDMAVTVYPYSGTRYEKGFTVWFNGNVDGGTPPYDYTWKSSLDGNLFQSLNDMNDMSHFGKDDLSLGIHTITHTVKDSVGHVVTKTLEINIVPLTPVSAIIDSPLDKGSYKQGVVLDFKASYAGGIGPHTVKWTSDKDGDLGANYTFKKNDLSVNSHKITLKATDSKGNTGSKTIDLSIVNPDPLTPAVLSPADNSQFKRLEDAVVLKASASGGVTPYTYSWKSSLDGVLSSNLNFSTSNLSMGNHTITFTLKDAVAKTVTASVNIKINSGCSTNNIKNSGKYSSGEAFLVSDSDWRDVLSLVPLSVWTEGAVTKYYPALIFHKEAVNFDAHSAIHFLQQYSPNHLSSIGTVPTALNNLLVAAKPTGAGMAVADITNITSADYLSYWSSFNTLVIADYDDYKSGLIASVLASQKNAPLLFINGANLNSFKSLIDGRAVYTVGTLDSATQSYISANASCFNDYTVSEAQHAYKSMVNSDKMLAVNPNDLAIKFSASYATKKSGNIGEIFSKMSLASPFLAAYRKEVIVFTELPDSGTNSGCVASALISVNLNQADIDIENGMKDLFMDKPEFLTIIASPNALPDSEFDIVSKCVGSWQHRYNWDNKYASFDNSGNGTEIKVGRIYGITASDALAYVARSIKYDELKSKIYGTSHSAFSVGHSFTSESNAASTITEKAKGSGYSAACYAEHVTAQCTLGKTPPVSSYEKMNIVMFSDHGAPNSWYQTLGYNNIPALDIPFVLGAACLTNNYFQSTGQGMGPHIIRRGAIGYLGSVGVTYLSNISKDAIKSVTANTGITLGELHKLYSIGMINDYSLLGDPVVQPKLKLISW